MTAFRRGDLVEYNGERWTVYAGQDARGTVDLCRTEDYARPLGTRVTGVSASVLRLVRSAPDRTLGKGADIDYIEREDRNAGLPASGAADRSGGRPASRTSGKEPEMTEYPERSSLVRMPNGVMDYLEHGADVVETAEAEAQSAVGDPETYERALARQQERLARPPSVRHTGTPIMTRLFELLAPGEED